MLKYQADLDLTFQALADGNRRSMVERLGRGPATVSELAEPLSISMPAVMQHLRVLEQADLVIVERRGRERWNHLNAIPIQRIHERWIGAYARHAAKGLSKLESNLENQPDRNPTENQSH